MAGTEILSANAQLFDGAGSILAVLGFGYLAWGLISPRTAMFWAKRWSRLWAIPIAAVLFLMGIGMTIYAEQHQPGAMIVFGLGLIALIAHTGTLPAREPQLALPGRAGAAALSRSAAETDAQVAAIRTALPDAQKPEFDALYDRHKRSGASNVDIARQCAANAARVWTLKNGKLPQLSSALPLAAGEQCVWKGDGARLTEDRLDTDTGTLYLTTKRLFFVGREQSVAIDFTEIATLIVTGATEIDIDRNQGEHFYFRSSAIADPFDRNLTGPFEILWGRVRP
jgi:hypothetical protein